MSETDEPAGNVALSAMLHETRRFDPPPEFAAHANAKPGIYEEATTDPVGWWEAQAEHLQWDARWESVLEWDLPFARWFTGGKLNASVNCVDRHVAEGRGDKVAFHWVGEPEQDRRTITYEDLKREVCRAANALVELGVVAGDRVAIYMPMIPEAVVAMLACARIGAPHSVVFGGFSADALSGRILDLGARVVLTADGGYRRGSVAELKPNVDEALKRCPDVSTVVVVRRTGQQVDWEEGRDHWWHELVDPSARHTRRRVVRLGAPLVHHVHERNDGKAEGDPPHDRRLPVAHIDHAPAGLRPETRHRRVLDGCGHRVGDRAQLHRLRTSLQRRHLCHVRGHP